MLMGMLVADFYGRKSTLDDGRSIEGQADDYDEDCAENGFTPGLQFADRDRSASRFAKRDRPDYETLVKHIESGQCQMISLWESSRGGRDLGPWIAFLDLCRRQGTLIRVISHNRTYDIRNRRDWRTLAEDGINSADESEIISERVKRGKRRSARKGLPTARLAYGFRRLYDDRGKFAEQVEHPEQATIVREIIHGYADGKSGGEIARSLNQRGIPVPQRPCPDDCDREHKHFRNMVWSDAQVRQIAIKPSYAGKRVHQREIVGDGKWEPIVDPKVWQKVYDVLSTPGRKAVADSRLAHWLTDVIACSLCGDGLGSVRRPTGMLAYQCRSCHKVSVSSRNLVEFLEPLIVARLDHPDALDLFVARDDARIAAAEAELKRLEKRFKELEVEAAKPDGMSPGLLAAAERGLTPQVKAAKAKLRELTVPAELAEFEGVDVAKNWYSYGPGVKRTLTKAVAKMVLTPGTRNGVRTFDQWRLAGSCWTGEDRTWGDVWAAS